MAPKPTQVLLLTAADCGFCADAKAVLARVAGEYDVRVDTLPLESHEGQELGRAGGVLFPPGTFLDGEPFAYGRLSERKLRRELRRRGATRRAA